MREMVNLTLRRIKEFVRYEGIPSSRYIHILGTNGKGQTSVFLESLLLKQGYSVGTFLSPHLFSITERIRIGGRKIGFTVFREAMDYIGKRMRKYNIELTYFEEILAIALYVFKKSNPDFIILEAGLGGRLDATNIIQPVLTVFTPISMDHTEYLGNTLEKIAEEKSAVIKRGSVVITNNKGVPLEVINRNSKRKKVEMFSLGKDIKIRVYKDRVKLICEGLMYSFAGRFLKFKTDFEKSNFLLALSCLVLLNHKKIIEISCFNLGNIKIYDFFGRFDTFRINGKKIIVDSAHNISAASALLKEIKYKKGNVLVVAMLKDKDISGFIKTIAKKFDIIIFSENNSFRKEKAFDQFLRVDKHIVKLNKRIFVIPDIRLAIKDAVFNFKGDVLITGSFYTSVLAIKELRRYESRI